jgi:hypothetical protein
MRTITVSLEEAEVGELKMIVMDKDTGEAFRFLKEKILAQILKREKRKMDVEGKIHL